MLKLVILGGLVLLILIVAATTRLMPRGTAAETTTPQHAYLHLHHDDDLIARPCPVIGGSQPRYR